MFQQVPSSPARRSPSPSARVALALLASLVSGLSACTAGPDVHAPSGGVAAPQGDKAGPTASSTMGLRVSPESGGHRVTIGLPAGARADTAQVKLNGQDVTARLHSVGCATGSCLEGLVGPGDGLQQRKNVLYATAKDSHGGVVSARSRFSGGTAGTTRSPALKANRAAALGASPTTSSFLPPSLSFTTNAPGGPPPNAPGTTWFTVGSEPFQVQCDGLYQYVAIVLDRHTLEQVADPVNQGCFGNTAVLNAYLPTLGTNELVIVGSTFLHNADSTLDTSPIGGSKYASVVSGLQPQGYMIIGVGGATPGTAYENYDVPAGQAVNPSANGMLIESVDGRYNFAPQNQGSLEYSVSPNDPSYAQLTTIRITRLTTSSTTAFTPPTMARSARVYSPPPPPSGSGGFWLMRFRRADMSDVGSCAQGTALAPIGPSDKAYPSCGAYYDTGNSDQTTATNEANRLQTDLSNLPLQTLVVLTTVGTPFATNLPIATNLDAGMASTLAALGAPTHAFPLLNQVGGAFTLVSSADSILRGSQVRPYFGASLAGDAVVSTTVLGSSADGGVSSQGQTGFVNGVLIPDNFGLYEPSISTQSDATGSGVNLTFHEITTLPPVEWPELTVPLDPGFTTVEGQQGAYAYLSYFLVTNLYLPGFQGPNANDLHYFFTGSLNTLLDLNTFDPQNVQPPNGQTQSPYTWPDPVANVTVTFTAADLQLVAGQMHAELQALKTVLTFMSTGSGNIKDLIAGGQNSMSLALIAAASNIEASSIAPPQSTPATVNWSDISNFLGGFISVASEIADLAMPEDAAFVAVVDTTLGISSGSLWTLGSLGFSNPGSTPQSDIPNPNRGFLTTLGSLANGEIQGQMAANFDASVDLITSDYNKLMLLNAQVLNDQPGGFYSARNQGQAAASAIMGYAAERSFYMNLLPSFYRMDTWIGFNTSITGNNPDIGGQYSPNGTSTPKCVPFYPYATMPADVYAGWPGIGQGGKFDVMVMGGGVTSAGSSKYNEVVPGADLGLRLFDSTGLHLPMLTFFDVNGPLPVRNGNPTDPTDKGFTGFNPYLCQPSTFVGLAPPPGTPPGTSPTTGDTTVTVAAPATAAEGADVALVASVTAIGVPTQGLTVLFFDGASPLGSAVVNASGKATLAVEFARGSHPIVAALVASATTHASESNAATVTVYRGEADFSLTASSASIEVGQGGSAVQLSLSPKNGFSSVVQLACSGLPDGYVCQFAPGSVNLGTGNATTQLVIVPTSN